MSRSKTILLYVGVALTATVFFLYLRFPTDLIKDLIGAQVSRSMPGLNLDIEILTPSFPAGVNLENIDISYQNKPAFRAEEVKISGRTGSLIRPQKEINYKLETSGGRISGKASFNSNLRRGGANVDADFRNIQLNKIPAIKAFSGYNVSGILDGKVKVDGSVRSGTGQANFTISQCTIKLPQPFFGVEQLNFQLIDALLTMEGQRVIVKKCDLNGEEVDGRIRGSMIVKQPYGQTQLNLSGVLKPQPTFSAKLSKMVPMALFSGTNIQRKGIPFKLTGTIDRPGFSLR